MPKIRRKSIENDFLLIFFCMQSEGVAQSSILMILRHPLKIHYSLQGKARRGNALIPSVRYLRYHTADGEPEM